LPETDADPGQNASIWIGDIPVLKQGCIDGGFGGFALYLGMGHMRRASGDQLKRRLERRFPNTTFFVAEELRLCGVWEELSEEGESAMDSKDRFCAPTPSSPSSPRGSPVKDSEGSRPLLPHCLQCGDDSTRATSSSPTSGADEECEEVHLPGADDDVLRQICQAAILVGSRSFVGFEVCPGRRPGWARLLPPLAAAAAAAAMFARRQAHGDASATGGSQTGEGRRLHLLRYALMRVELEAFESMDAYVGCNAKVLWGATLAQCKQVCVEEGFGGFCLFDGAAHFRAASPAVLRRKLNPSSQTGGTFYIVTCEELTDGQGDGADASGGAPEGVAAVHAARGFVAQLLPQLWRPSR